MPQKNGSSLMEEPKHGHPETKGLLLLSLCLLLFLTLISFAFGEMHRNFLGLAGYYIAFGLQYLFGITSYPIVFFVGHLGYRLLTGKSTRRLKAEFFYGSIAILSLSFLLNLLAEFQTITHPFFQRNIYSESLVLDFPYLQHIKRFYLGGRPTYFLLADVPVVNLHRLLSPAGVAITSSILMVLSLILFTNVRVLLLLRHVKRIRLPKFRYKACAPTTKASVSPQLNHAAKALVKEPPLEIKKECIIPFEAVSNKSACEREEREIHINREKSLKTSFFNGKKHFSSKEPSGSSRQYRLPPIHLLTNVKQIDQPSLKNKLKEQAETLERALVSFGIEGLVGKIHCGPTITSFEVHPPVGVKVQKIKALENDIALNLQAKSIRIIAPIPGKAAVGVEVPSLYPQAVGFKEMLISYQKKEKRLTIPMFLGKTVTGEDIVYDLVKMPHCIIAGATGSGKSVCINSIVVSILMTACPDEVKLLLVDPKKVELSGYTHLPHLLAPVITEAHGAYAALNWLVKEMQNRYDLLKRLKLRNITAFNQRDPEHDEAVEGIENIPNKMPVIVAIIDEFADLMMASSANLETPIARIAQMARAVGIHLILATQRPSRDVITGLIKANFPTRIAFKVSSRINSQIILDETGAESLLGNGDLLFIPPTSSQMVRSQGVYICDADINRVVSFICKQLPPNYVIKSFDQLATKETKDGENEVDTLYSQALLIVKSTKNASTTFLQRKLKIGYARAAGLMDALEKNQVVSPPDGARPRKVLVSDLE